MNDLHDAIRQAVFDYINVEQLPIRRQKKVKDTYSRFQYDWDTVDGLVETGTEDQENAS
jgi:hypothetical protein